MNLYIFNETRRGSVYGVGTYISELTTALKNSNINICVVNLMSKTSHILQEYMDGIQYLHFPLAMSYERITINQKEWELYYHNIVYLLQLYIKDKNELIFHLNYCQNSALAEELKRSFVCRIVCVIHFSNWGFTIHDNLERLRHILKKEQPDGFDKNVKESIENEKSVYLAVDRVICLSNYMQEILCQDYGIDESKISLVPNGLCDMFDVSINRKQLREKWNIQGEEKVILFAGRVDEVKGVVYLIKVFQEVVKKFPGCRLIIAGSGNYDSCLKEAKECCTKVTLTGLVEKQALRELYQLADIGVTPSLFEPFGYVPVEMMMHKLPIVATATSGLNEVVDDTCGIKVPLVIQSDRVEIDTTLLAEKILYLLEHPTEAKQMGENGRKRYLEKYSSETFRMNMLEVYKSVSLRPEGNKIKTLIVTGQNSHKWEVSHIAIKQILKNSGLFAVDLALSPQAGKLMSNFKPDFASYQLVVLDYCGDRWPEETEKAFLDFVEEGGGVVIYHAANNAFREWKEYNRIIGFGGWENRDETDGPYIYLKDEELVYDDVTPGRGGSHGSRHEFILNGSNANHPITKGLPSQWLHAQDELYDKMRGPGNIQDVLFWAYSDPATKGSGRNEIAIFTVDYGKARIFHTTLGHVGNSLEDNTAMQCTGFQVTLLRGAEWAATGKVTQHVPEDFPTETRVSLRKNYKEELVKNEETI